MGKKDYYKSGTWNALCDVCGRKFKASKLLLRWDNLRVCKKDYEERHIADFFRGRPDDQSVAWTRPEGSNADSPAVLLNKFFLTNEYWSGNNWTVGGCLATHTTGSSTLAQDFAFVAGESYEVIFRVVNRTSGTITPRYGGGTAVLGTARSADGEYTETIIALTGNNVFTLQASVTFNGSIDYVHITEL